MAQIETRVLTGAEVETAVDWAAREGWNPGLADGASFHGAAPDAFLGAFTGGEMAACISVVRYSRDYGFLGFYICRPDLRGQGIGYGLWRAALAREEIAAIGLDGVVDQQENYRKSGFIYAHANHRYGGAAEGRQRLEPVQTPVRRYGPELRDALGAYDRGVFGLDRARFLEVWTTQPEARVLVAGESGCAGYGVLRPCREGAKIGPLFADDPETARALYLSLTEGRAGPVFLDVPAPNAAAADLARAAGLAPVFETARMYRGPAPAMDLHRTFGITTFEFG